MSTNPAETLEAQVAEQPFQRGDQGYALVEISGKPYWLHAFIDNDPESGVAKLIVYPSFVPFDKRCSPVQHYCDRADFCREMPKDGLQVIDDIDRYAALRYKEMLETNDYKYLSYILGLSDVFKARLQAVCREVASGTLLPAAAEEAEAEGEEKELPSVSDVIQSFSIPQTENQTSHEVGASVFVRTEGDWCSATVLQAAKNNMVFCEIPALAMSRNVHNHFVCTSLSQGTRALRTPEQKKALDGLRAVQQLGISDDALRSLIIAALGEEGTGSGYAATVS